MKVAYIAHPISGDLESNLNKVKSIGRQINLTEPDVVPFAPYFFDLLSLSDKAPEERNRGLKNNIALIKKGFIDEVRLHGGMISEGMKVEIEAAIECGIPITPMTNGTQRDFDKLFGKPK